MKATYRAQLMEPTSFATVAVLDWFVSINWARESNAVQECSLSVYFEDIGGWGALAVLRRNTRIFLWRDIGQGPMLAGDTVWILRRILYDWKNNTVTLYAQDANCLLDSRIVAYTPQTIESDKTIDEYETEFGIGFTPPVADDMIKMYVRENMGTLAVVEPERDLVTAGYLRIEEDQSLGPAVEKTASFQNLLTTLQDICTSSETLAVPLFFDMLPDIGTNSFLFRTWINYRGRDRSASSEYPLILSPLFGNLTGVELEVDYTTEYNTLYFLGIGSGSDRWVEVYTNDESVRLDPFGRREMMHEESNADNEDGYMDRKAPDIMRKNRSKVVLRGDVVDSPQTLYGVDYNFGDLVTVALEGMQFDCFIKAVSASVSDGDEQISIKLESTRPL